MAQDFKTMMLELYRTLNLFYDTDDSNFRKRITPIATVPITIIATMFETVNEIDCFSIP